MDVVESYTDNGLAVITLANSSQGNLLNGASLSALNQAFDAAIADSTIRVVVLRSDGEHFCLGMDLAILEDAEVLSRDSRAIIDSYSTLLLKIFRAPKPIISVVAGEVKGGGMGLLSACDIVIASDSATFEFSEVLFGLIPANVLPFLLVSRLTLHKAGYLILTAKQIGADEALRINLIDEVHPEDELEKRVKAILRRLFRGAPSAQEAAKLFMRKILYDDIEAACRQAQDELLALISRPDVRSEIKRFREGELPYWFTRFSPEEPIVKKGRK